MEIPQHKYQEAFDSLRCCVIIPTYNNAQTLAGVIGGVEKYTKNVIIVNDGATDSTPEILKEFTHLQIITQERNKGKGKALLTGFKAATEKGFQYAITIDSDGQHNPDELPLFLETIKENPGALIVGARNMNQASVPGKSSFGHKFSNFWFTVETGIKLPDTQSGFRLYPVERLKNIWLFTPKFEFEIEVLVKAAWRGIPVISVPVSVKYEEKEKRISHFRPFRDFTRISILNTVLVILALAYYRPLLYLKELRKNGWRQILESDASNLRLSLAMGFGMFMGIVPIWGYQMIAGVALAHFFRFNKILVLLFSNISVPPMIPIILFLSFRAGEYFVSDPVRFLWGENLNLESMKTSILQYIFGSIALAIVTGILCTLISLLILSLTRKK